MQLLREFEETKPAWKRVKYGCNKDIIENRFMIMSHEYGFIYWLLKNDKLDLTITKILFKKIYFKGSTERRYHLASEYEWLLMLGATNTAPLWFLIGMLK